MTPAWKQQLRCDAAAGARLRATDPPLSKRIGGVPQLQPWSSLPLPHSDPIPPTSRINRHPAIPVFHTRHAEESAERPRLVTVVRPCSHSAIRKVTVLLNRRGVVSYEQLLLDISEALGFPRWHRARVTRLYTPHAREVHGVCDFFRGEVAFLALGKSRPDLQSVKEALEELFPQHSRYRDDALRAWERKLRPPPEKAAKADSGYSEGTDTHTHLNTHTQRQSNTRRHTDTHTHLNTDTQTQSNTRRHTDTHTRGGGLDTHRRADTRPNQHPSHPPNHLQRVRVKDANRQRLSLPIGPLPQDEEVGGKTDTPPPPRCRNCKLSEQPGQRAGRIRLPPVARKQTGNRPNHQVVEKPNAGLASRHTRPTGRIKEESISQSECSSDSKQEKVGSKYEVLFDLPSDDSVVTLSDIERCYDIGHIIGDGNFAVVRECRRHDNREAFAMKIVERSKLIGREHMMQNELSLMGSLSHPRVVRLLTHHHTHTHSYLVMEMVAGGDLFEAIAERGKYPEQEAGLMVCDVSEALTYIHSKSIVHRDLKPENLLVEYSSDGVTRLKLGDFGLAMVVTEPIFTVCGTPTYVAPEILSETGYGLPVDLWALGVILYILLCGFPPFRSKNRDQEELFQLVREGQLSFLSPYWDDISDGALSLVRALLQVDPTERLTAVQTLTHPWIQTASDHHRPLQTSTDPQTPLRTRTPPTRMDHHRPAQPIKEQCRPPQNHSEQHRPVHSPTPTDQRTLLQTSRELQNHPPDSSRQPESTGCLPQQEHPSTPTSSPPPPTKTAPSPQSPTQQSTSMPPGTSQPPSPISPFLAPKAAPHPKPANHAPSSTPLATSPGPVSLNQTA